MCPDIVPTVSYSPTLKAFEPETGFISVSWFRVVYPLKFESIIIFCDYHKNPPPLSRVVPR